MTRIALINPNWNFDGSIYFGCRSPHLPLEHSQGDEIGRRADRRGHPTEGSRHPHDEQERPG